MHLCSSPVAYLILQHIVLPTLYLHSHTFICINVNNVLLTCLQKLYKITVVFIFATHLLQAQLVDKL